MPGRDGTGPIGNGSRSGRGLGNCVAPGAAQGTVNNTDRPYRQRLGLWDATLGRIFRRRRSNRANQRYS
jgi:hypothetical protein